MAERTGLVNMKGLPLTLVGPEIKVGEKAPDAELTGNDMAPVRLSQYKGKVVILAAVPSLDTPICDIETRRFNNEVTHLSPDIVVLTVSMDLPFAQKRWCGANGVERVVSLSDHRSGSFGETYGVLIKELRLLARAVWVLDRDQVVRYAELLPELGQEPNYSAALEVAHALSK